MASQVVVGIGFIGAGMIFRQGTAVRNLTTAASLWVTAAVGLTAGVGDLGTAAVGAVVMVAALVALRPLRDWIRSQVAREERELRIRLHSGQSPDAVVAAVNTLPDVTTTRLTVHKEDGDFVVMVALRAQRRTHIDDRVSELSARPDVVDLTEVAAGE